MSQREPEHVSTIIPDCIVHHHTEPCPHCSRAAQHHAILLKGTHLRRDVLLALGDWAVALGSLRRKAQERLTPENVREFAKLNREEKAALEILKRSILRAWGLE